MDGVSDATAPFALAEAAAKELVRRVGERPDVAVVLGSGWRAAAGALGAPALDFPMTELPGFMKPTVQGHGGSLLFLPLGSHRVLVMAGRSHLYEGRTPSQVVHAVRTAVIAGARVVVLTNAAGSLHPALRPGELVLVRDHINLTGVSPLTGAEPPPGYGARFVDLTDLYAIRLRQVAGSVVAQARNGTASWDHGLAEGVYAGLPGPNYETPAEVAMLRALGADLVGMSTVLEAIAARHLGAAVLGLSLVTNLAAGVSDRPLDHAEVLAAGAAAVPRIGQFFAELLPKL
ncbi:MAG TPA: purine-nucleoside phosphorylase [Acidimicrobiales bacterium]|nr:purine-nucleoside phosphorylase [Acidimicrobiales bacterium]